MILLENECHTYKWIYGQRGPQRQKKGNTLRLTWYSLPHRENSVMHVTYYDVGFGGREYGNFIENNYHSHRPTVPGT